MNYISFQIHGGGSGLGLVGLISGFLEFLESLAGKTPPEMFAAIFPGIGSMENVHPMLVHFPIAFFYAFFLVECAGLFKNKPQWRYVASWLLYLGTVMAMFTVAAGVIAADSVEHDEAVHEIMERHEHIGLSILALSLFLTFWRSQRWFNLSGVSNRFFLVLAALLSLLVTLGADLGGLMVYGHGVSVHQSVQAEPSSQKGGLQELVEGHPHGGHDHHHGGHDHHHE